MRISDWSSDVCSSDLRYVDALHELIARKRKSKSNRKIIEEQDEPSGRGAANVVDLMAALKKSIEKPKAKPAQKRSTTTTRADRKSTHLHTSHSCATSMPYTDRKKKTKTTRTQH